MLTSRRFQCPSASLTLRSLLKRTRRALLIGSALAAAAHAALTQLTGLTEEQRVAKPLTTHFVKRQPRLTKPLELKKRPQPRRRQIEREMVAVKAKVAGKEVAGTAPGIGVLGSLARPRTQTSREMALASRVLEPQAMAQAIEGAKESQHTVDMSLEMIDLEALDTGRYQAMVIVDPNDKRSIKGYVHLFIAYPFSAKWEYSGSDQQAMMSGLRNLVGKLNEWTDIRASVAGQVSFDSAEFLRTPWTYFALGLSMQPTRSEVENLGRYLLGGGFFFFEGQNFQGYQGQLCLTRFLESALQSQGYRQGVDWEYQLLPTSHPIFHCYYEFPDGPPAGHTLEMHARAGRERNDGVAPWARGVEIDGRMVALNTNQQYLLPWVAWGRTSAPLFADNTRAKYSPTAQFRFGINTIIFALTQEGSITRRLMDSVR